MSMILLKSDYPHNHISVPLVFIDEYMADANGEFVKVYLFLLRCMTTSASSECSISSIADHFNHTENDILRALKYWEKVGVLNLELDSDGQLTALCFKDLTEDNKAPKEAVKEVLVSAADFTSTADCPPLPQKEEVPAVDKEKSKKTEPAEERTYTLDEVKTLYSDTEVTELLFIIETYLKHPLSSFEMNTIFYWCDVLKFSPELIEYLVEYCISNGHSSLRYMDKVALSWAENEINTTEKAKEHIAVRSKAYYGIMKAFGISGRNLADSEIDFINKWSNEFGFDLSLIQEACRRTISATQKPSFEYANSILTNWHKNHVRTLNDIASLDEVFNRNKKNSPVPPKNNIPPRRNKFNNFHQRTYDSDEYEKMLLTTNI